MSIMLWSVDVAALRMQLWESDDRKRYSLVFRILAQPHAVSITYLGDDRRRAVATFTRKVEYHRELERT